MKKCIFLLLFIMLIVTEGLMQELKKTELGIIRVAYDKFAQTTTLSPNEVELSKYVSPSERPMFVVGVTCNGKKISQSTIKEISVAWYSWSDKWKYLNNHNVRCLIDGKPLVIPETQHNGDVDSRVTEMIWTQITYSTLAKLWNAGKVEFQVGSTEFELSKGELNMLAGLKSHFVK